MSIAMKIFLSLHVFFLFLWIVLFAFSWDSEKLEKPTYVSGMLTVVLLFGFIMCMVWGI